MFSMCLSTALSVLCGLGSGQPTVNVHTEAPAISSVARGAQRVPVLHITLAVPCSSQNVTVSSLTIERRGLGRPSDITHVYVLDGTTRITRAYTLPSNHEPLTVALRGLGIDACKTRNLTLAVDFSAEAEAASEHAFRLVSVQAGNAAVTLETPTSKALQVGASGTPAIVTAELLPVLTTVSYGRNKTVARLSLQGTAGKNQRITAITLTNNGSAADDNLQNLAWYTRTGEKISDVLPQLQGRMARIMLSPGLLLEGRDTKLIELHADVRSSRKRTIRWSIEEPSDIEAVEVRTR